MNEEKAPDALLQAVGSRFRDIRQSAGLTKRAVAEAAGLSEAYVWRVEDGRQNLSLRSLSKLAIALRVPMAELLRDVDPS